MYLADLAVGRGKEIWLMDSYKCKLCGYVYNPAIGDSANDVKPGTAFEEIPETWKCPRCGAGKSRFTKV